MVVFLLRKKKEQSSFSKIILDFAETAENVEANQIKKIGLFIRTENELSDIYKKCNEIISSRETGDIPVYFYFSSSKKYFPCKKISLDDITLVQLKAIAGEQNVILQK